MKSRLQLVMIMFSILILIIIAPVVINESYKCGGEYITIWGAEDVLSYYGVSLSFVGTILLSVLALYQNRKANDISNRLLKIEESRQKPYVDFADGINTKSNFIELYSGKKDEMMVRIYLKNISDAVAKGCNLVKVELAFMDNYYFNENVHTGNFLFDKRSILPQDRVYYHFNCIKQENEDKIKEFNNFFKKNSPGTINGEAITEGMFIIKLHFEIIDMNDKKSKQRIWCFFKQDIEDKEKYTIWNRIIEMD